MPCRNMLPLVEVSEILGIPACTLRAWCRRGKIPSAKGARNYLVSLAWLESFILKAGGNPAIILAKHGLVKP